MSEAENLRNLIRLRQLEVEIVMMRAQLEAKATLTDAQCAERVLRLTSEMVVASHQHILRDWDSRKN